MRIRSILVVGFLFFIAALAVGMASPAGQSAQAAQPNPCDGLAGKERRDCLHEQFVERTEANRQRRQEEIAQRKIRDQERRDAEKAAMEAQQAEAKAKWEAQRAELVRSAVEGCRTRGFWMDCQHAVEILPEGSPVALEMALKGCNSGDRGSCDNAGLQYEKYSTEPNHMTLAVKYYKIACSSGVSESCMKLKSESMGTSGTAAVAEIVQSYQKKCAAGDGLACNELGYSFYKGQLTAEDPGKAAQFFDRGCKLGNKVACDSAAQTHEELEKPRRDAAREAASQATFNDPHRKTGVNLSRADLACLKEERHAYTTTSSTGECATTLQAIPGAGQYCPKYKTSEETHVSVNLTNVCKRTISFEETCDSTGYAWGTLLPGDVYERKAASCRLTY